MSNVTETAMLAKLSIGMWTAQTLDRKVSGDVANRANAKGDVGKFYKNLIRSPMLNEYRKNADAARIYHANNSLPWSDGGVRILPVAMYQVYTQCMREFREEAERIASRVVAEYSGDVETAREELGNLFNEADYPNTDAILGKFHFSVNLLPVPQSGDWRVDLGKEEVDAIKSDIEDRLNETFAAGTRELWGRLHTAIKHMHERLADTDKIFRNSLVTNMRELVDLLPALNIMDDADLDLLAKEAKAKLCKSEAQDLRDNEAQRTAVAKEAADILKKMEAYVTA